MIGIVIQLLSLSVTMFILFAVIDGCMCLYRHFKRQMLSLINKKKKLPVQETTVVNTYCGEQYSEKCKGCAYIRECFGKRALENEENQLKQDT